ncbi:hypothetical protein B0H11DRAFT_1960804 [Mycena galericulata]|nr:hypothetical protein B0H11DRAFT_1960804 [Mycena galericulata]
MRDFSQELIDLVLDYVAVARRDDKRYWNGPISYNWNAVDERDSLRSDPPIAVCGLVCKQWLPRSRFHLFSTGRLHGLRLESLVEIDRASSLQLFSIFRKLTLKFFAKGSFKSESMEKLRDCANLTCIRISAPPKAPQFRSFLDTHFPFLGTHCVSLYRFEWSAANDTISLRTIADILLCLPRLEVFCLDSESCKMKQEELPPSYSWPVRLRTLELKVEHGVDALFTWLLSLPVLPIITSLTLYEGDQPTGTSLAAYSHRAGSGFETLSLRPSRANLTEPIGILRHATELRHLTLHSQEALRVPTTISTLPSSNLITLTIKLDLLDPLLVHDVRLIPYALIDQALAHPSLRSLERFSLEDYSSVEYSYVSVFSPEVKGLMPLANARGILA